VKIGKEVRKPLPVGDLVKAGLGLLARYN